MKTTDHKPPAVGPRRSEPSYAELRARNLLAQSILNQRATPDGLSRDDAAAVAGALVGVWDRPEEVG